MPNESQQHIAHKIMLEFPDIDEVRAVRLVLSRSTQFLQTWVQDFAVVRREAMINLLSTPHPSN
jgi:hypothetical protein